MKCQNCNKEIEENNKFCPFCGSPQNTAAPVQQVQTVKCPSCGTEVNAGQSFCMNCGTRLPMMQAAAQQNSQSRPSQTAPPIIPAGPHPSGALLPGQVAKCPGCGAEVNAGQSFCMSCGTRMPVIPSGGGQNYAQNQQAYYQQNSYTAAAPRPNPGQKIKGAGVGIRFAAVLLDGILVSIAMKFLMGGIFVTGINQITYTGTIDYSMFYIPAALNAVYFVLMEGLFGTTLGKLVCGLRVVTKDGEKCGMGRSIIRNLIRIVEGMSLYLISAIFVWATANNKRLGDIAAGTLVVKKRG